MALENELILDIEKCAQVINANVVVKREIRNKGGMSGRWVEVIPLPMNTLLLILLWGKERIFRWTHFDVLNDFLTAIAGIPGITKI